MNKIYIITYVHEDEDGTEFNDVLPVLRFGYFLNEEDAISKARQLNKSMPEEVFKMHNEHYSHTVVFQAKTEE